MEFAHHWNDDYGVGVKVTIDTGSVVSEDVYLKTFKDCKPHLQECHMCLKTYTVENIEIASEFQVEVSAGAGTHLLLVVIGSILSEI